MQNKRLKNRILPWQEKGRWYKFHVYGKATTSGGTTTYTWEFVNSSDYKSDNFFGTGSINILQFSTSGTTGINLKNNSGKALTVKDVKRIPVKYNTTSPTTLSPTAGAETHLIPPDRTLTLPIGLTASSANTGFNYVSATTVVIRIELFIE